MTGDANPATVSGYTARGFQAVREVFTDTVAGQPGGAAVAVVRDSQLVVDLWAGHADDTTGRPWDRGTRAVMFSATKGLVALCAAALVGRGLLDYDAPIAGYWPQYAAHGKGATTVRDALSHRAGVPALDAVLTREQALSWGPVTDALTEQVPLWEPGTAYGYHALTYGWLVGEVIRRVTGLTPRDWLREHLTGPRGLDPTIGLPVGDQATVATVLAPPPPTEPPPPPGIAELVEDRAVSMNGVLTFPTAGVRLRHSWNDPDVLAAELPGANGISTARGLARLYAAATAPVGDQPAYLTPGVLADAMTTRSQGPDWVNTPGPGHRWGTGFILPNEVRPMFGPTSYGHDGAGGQLAFADPATHSAFAYLTSRMGPDDDTRANRLTATTLACLTAT